MMYEHSSLTESQLDDLERAADQDAELLRKMNAIDSMAAGWIEHARTLIRDLRRRQAISRREVVEDAGLI
jgi:hypothetical protein